jgi:hypothetical protein
VLLIERGVETRQSERRLFSLQFREKSKLAEALLAVRCDKVGVPRQANGVNRHANRLHPQVLGWSSRRRLDRRSLLVVPKGIWSNPRVISRGVHLRERRRPMPKLTSLRLFAALLAFSGLAGADARSAELEGALQYPPLSVGEDAQPPPPARMLPPPVSPWRIELGVSGSSMPPSTQRFYLLSPPRLDNPLDKPGPPPPSESGG